MARVQRQKVLVVFFRRIEAFQWLDLRRDRPAERAGMVELLDIGFRQLHLARACREYGRAVLRSGIGALAAPLRRIMRHREEDAQQLAGRDHARIIGDLDQFRMAGAPGADSFILRRIRRAAGIAGDRRFDALHMLEHALHAPETAAGDDKRLCRRLGGSRPPAPG